MRIFCLTFSSWLLLSFASAKAREIYVDNQTGNDQHAGTADAPLRSVRRGVMMAAAGDTIHLLPERAIYREVIMLADKRDITIAPIGFGADVYNLGVLYLDSTIDQTNIIVDGNPAITI